MEQFNYLNTENLINLKKYLYLDKTRNCDFTIGVLFSWHDYFKTKYLIKDNTLYLKSKYTNKYCYNLPLGEKNDISVIIDDYLNNEVFPLHLSNLNDEEVACYNKKFPHSESTFNRDWSDYIYLTNNFVEYKGKKYSTRRHQLNKFKTLYPNVIFKEALSSDKENIKDFIRFFAKTKIINTQEAINEEDEAIKVIDYYELLGLRCFILIDEQKIIGVAVIELSNDVIFDHIEKCLRDYQGIYAFMTNSIACTFQNYKYFSREDDSGDPGLRYSKTELHPEFMVNKYVFKVLNNLDLIDVQEDIMVDNDITLGSLKEEFKEDYFRLSVDEELNKYWGYDYRDDLNGIEASGDYFYNMVVNDFKNKEVITYMIYVKGKLAGEILAYHLTNDNGAEIGIRLFKEYQNRGIASKSLQKFISFLFSQYKMSYLTMVSYKENSASIRLIEKHHFEYINENELGHVYKLINQNC